MTAEVTFGENPFVDAEAETLGPDDWQIGEWQEVGLISALDRHNLRVVENEVGSTAAGTTLEVSGEPVEQWRVEAAAELLEWLRADKPHSVAEAIAVANRK